MDYYSKSQILICTREKLSNATCNKLDDNAKTSRNEKNKKLKNVIKYVRYVLKKDDKKKKK